MSATAFTSLSAALVAALAQVPALAGVKLTSGARRQPLGDYLRRVDVQLLATQGRQIYAGAGAPTTWDTTLQIAHLARAAAGDTPDDDLDALLLATAVPLQAFWPAGLGLIAVDLEPKVSWAVIDGAPPFAIAQRTLRITHSTAGLSLQP